MTGPSGGGLEELRDALRVHALNRSTPLSLDLVCEFAGTRLRAAVAVTLLRAPSAAAVISAPDPLARVAEELQLTVGEGPSVEGFSAVGILLVDDLATAEQQSRWPLFAPGAVEAGVKSLCVVPLRVGAARFGTFAVYFGRPGALDVDTLAEVVLLAAIALDVLLDQLGGAAGTCVRLDGRDAHDRVAEIAARLLDDRPEIHQATGMVSVQLLVDLPTALLHLRARAFADGRMLSDLAADVVGGVVRFHAEGASEPP